MKKIIVLCLVALMGVGMAVAQGPKKGGKGVTTTTVFMTNLDCQGCAKKINDTIPYEKGVKDVKVDVDTKTVTVTFDPAKTNNENLVKAFAKVKIEAAPMEACGGECCGHHHEAKPEKKECTDGCCDGHEHKAEHKAEHKHEAGCCDGHDHKAEHKHDHGHAHNHAK